VKIRQMVQSASDAEDGDLIESVVIEKATSDEPDNAPGHDDGHTRNDILIARDCKSVRLRTERDEERRHWRAKHGQHGAAKNGRVYSVTLRVADSAGNITRAEFKVSVPLLLRHFRMGDRGDQSGALAVEDPPAFTVTSASQ
jgi:hypothetical protein